MRLMRVANALPTLSTDIPVAIDGEGKAQDGPRGEGIAICLRHRDHTTDRVALNIHDDDLLLGADGYQRLARGCHLPTFGTR
jgi:hypothetical protein